MWREALVGAPVHHGSTDSHSDQGVQDPGHSAQGFRRTFERPTDKNKMVAQPDQKQQSLFLQVIVWVRPLSACPRGS